MSKKYVIEIKPEYEDSFKGVMLLGAKDSNLFVDTLAVENLEQYTPVDVEKIYDTAYGDGYNKGLKDGKAKDDKIEVGDEVNWLGDCFIVTRIFQPHNMKEQCDGIDDDGCVYHDVLMDDIEKTGRHFDIASILEAMKA